MYGTPRNRETEQGANQQGRRVRARNGFVRRAAPAAAQPPQGPVLQVPNNVDVANVQNQEQVLNGELISCNPFSNVREKMLSLYAFVATVRYDFVPITQHAYFHVYVVCYKL